MNALSHKHTTLYYHIVDTKRVARKIIKIVTQGERNDNYRKMMLLNYILLILTQRYTYLYFYRK